MGVPSLSGSNSAARSCCCLPTHHRPQLTVAGRPPRGRECPGRPQTLPPTLKWWSIQSSYSECDFEGGVKSQGVWQQIRCKGLWEKESRCVSSATGSLFWHLARRCSWREHTLGPDQPVTACNLNSALVQKYETRVCRWKGTKKQMSDGCWRPFEDCAQIKFIRQTVGKTDVISKCFAFSSSCRQFLKYVHWKPTCVLHTLNEEVTK